MRKPCLILVVIAFAGAAAQSASDFGSGAHPLAQAAADRIREAAGAEAAFLPAGLLKASSGTNLASILQYPSDEIVVVALKGSELKRALERSLANYPQFNSGFLQISGITVTFSQSAPPDSRIIEVSVNDSPLLEGRQYQVAMPANLANGSLGYFKIWKKSQIVKKTGVSLEQELKGKTGSVRPSRYIAKP